MNHNLTEDELIAKDILENDFLPTLEFELKRGKNFSIVMSKYAFNYCRQASIFSLKILQELLPDYHWDVWESIWICDVKRLDSDKNRARFDHAWVYGFNSLLDRHLIIDLTLEELDDSISNAQILHDNYSSFRIVKGNYFPEDMPDYKNIEVISKEQIDIDNMMEIKEIYTNLKGEKLIKQVCRRMKNKDKLNNLIYNK